MHIYKVKVPKSKTRALQPKSHKQKEKLQSSAFLGASEAGVSQTTTGYCLHVRPSGCILIGLGFRALRVGRHPGDVENNREGHGG